MGSGGSKGCGCNGAPSSSSTSSILRRTRSRGSKLFQSCLRPSRCNFHVCGHDNQISDHQNKENGPDDPCTEQTESVSDQVKVKDEEPNSLPYVSSITDLDDWNNATAPSTASGVGSSSAQSLNPSSRFLSRFSFVPGNISFRLSRATSVGSSRAYPVSSASFTNSDNDEELHLGTQPPSGVFIGNETRLDNESQMRHYEDSSGSLGFNVPAYDFLNCNVARDDVNSTLSAEANLRSPRNHSEIENNDSQLLVRRIGNREPIERNVRFSRTLSVGRLRDRVLRRSTLSDMTTFPLHREREERDDGQNIHVQAQVGEASPLVFGANIVNSPSSSGNPLSSISTSLFNSQSYEVETSRPRETRYHDLLEHRSNFLERRRRIRSQVRALQRLGNRFENLSGHERSCILSGQHRTGRCTCRISHRDANSNNDSSARASISRIVMLAEALFEVLDEIHQQSVVLTSRPSVSAIGSVPAPSEVVDSLPVKLHTRLQKQQIEDAAQCYICLLEYEEGDSIRILPCHHEFHKACIDKWLKEIHRVCPLCRGDICRSDPLHADS